MLIKKFTAKNSRSVMAQIREEFGPDAILLSSKNVGDQFEMVAAPNYDDHALEQELASQLTSRAAEQAAVQAANEDAIRKDMMANKVAELERLNQQEQHSLEKMQDEMAQLRKLIEAQLELERTRRKRREHDLRVNRSRPGTLARSQSGQTDRGQNLQQNKVLNSNRNAAGPVARIDRSRFLNADQDKQDSIDKYLADIGLSKKLRALLQKRLQGIDTFENASVKTMQILADAVQVVDTAGFPDKGIAAFVGGEHSGKTTALIKLAQNHRKRHGTEGMGIISLQPGKTANNRKDVVDEGASKNSLLRKYATTLGIRCLSAETPRQLSEALKSLGPKKLVLIDCCGRLEPESRLYRAVQELQVVCPKLRTFLTIAADTTNAYQEYFINAYADLNPAVIVTKPGNSRYLGGLVELLIRKKVPLGYIDKNKNLDANIVPGQSEMLIRMALDLGNLPEDSAVKPEGFEKSPNATGHPHSSFNKLVGIAS